MDVSLNYRRAAERLPQRMGIGPFWQETSVAWIRLTFAFFALWGGGVFALGLAHALR